MSLRIITHSFYRVSNLFGSNLFLLIYEALTRRPRRGCRVTSAHLRPVSRALQREGWSQRPRALLETHSIGHRIGVRFSFQRASRAPFPVGPFRFGRRTLRPGLFPVNPFFSGWSLSFLRGPGLPKQVRSSSKSAVGYSTSEFSTGAQSWSGFP